MMVPLWASELAKFFWRAAGEAEPFPRRLQRPIANAVPMAVVLLPRPTVKSIEEWLRDNGIICPLNIPSRRMRACPVARNGYGFAFIDATDPEDEQRFSLAHELAHFLRDYLLPRRQAVERIGAAAIEVLDGQRPSTADERIHTVLSGVQIGYHVHLMDCDEEDGSMPNNIAAAESDADRLAYELLAPAEHIAANLGCVNELKAIVEMLVSDYGLPRRHAERYARLLVPRKRAADPFLLRIATAT